MAPRSRANGPRMPLRCPLCLKCTEAKQRRDPTFRRCFTYFVRCSGCRAALSLIVIPAEVSIGAVVKARKAVRR